MGQVRDEEPADCTTGVVASRILGMDRVIATEAKHRAAATTHAQW